MGSTKRTPCQTQLLQGTNLFLQRGVSFLCILAHSVLDAKCFTLRTASKQTNCGFSSFYNLAYQGPIAAKISKLPLSSFEQIRRAHCCQLGDVLPSLANLLCCLVESILATANMHGVSRRSGWRIQPANVYGRGPAID